MDSENQSEMKGSWWGLWIVRWRHKYVGAPVNRMKYSLMEFVLTPRGKDMIPILGPVVTISPTITLSHLCMAGK